MHRVLRDILAPQSLNAVGSTSVALNETETLLDIAYNAIGKVFAIKNSLCGSLGKIPNGDQDGFLYRTLASCNCFHFLYRSCVIIPLPAPSTDPSRDILNQDEFALVAVVNGYCFGP
jgi:hypothetical protein